MPSIEISLSNDSHGVSEFTRNHHRRNGSASSTSAMMMALHDEDKVSEAISFSRVASTKDDGEYYVDEKGQYYHEIIQISDEIEDTEESTSNLGGAATIKRTLSHERFTPPTDMMGQFQWIIQHNFASRAMPIGGGGLDTRKRSPFAVNFVEHRI